MVFTRLFTALRGNRVVVNEPTNQREAIYTTSYTIVHVSPNNTESVVAVTVYREDLPKLVETPEWSGTWLTPMRKLLRHGKGELLIRTGEVAVRISGCTPINSGNHMAYDLQVAYSLELKVIRLRADSIAGYGHNGNQLWNTSSFTVLADIVGKEVAYQCSQYYERYLQEFELTGAM